ncbi:hypothetical protein [Bacillus mycoides]|uniref:hypothetical protein n=1 Tax=Bacillus mycoides TaxID=1405 RepID=UPI00027989E9|nr:hypothetical protein [Bacillus mycoides]EJR93328.1 hypothetical protein IKM_05986 [Bacillus mycoides]
MNNYEKQCSGPLGDMNNDPYNCNCHHFANSNSFNTGGPLDTKSTNSYIKFNCNPRAVNYLLDINGNPVRAGQSYSLRSRYKSGKSTQVSYWNWHSEQYLGTYTDESASDDVRFTFSYRVGGGMNIELGDEILIRAQETNVSTSGNYAKVCVLPGYGVCLAGSTNAASELWIPVQSTLSPSGTFTFQNHETRGFLGSTGPGNWLTPNNSLSQSAEVNFEIVPV